MSQIGEHNLALLAESWRERVGDHELLHFEGAWHSSGEILDRAGRVAVGLTKLGVEPGDRVVVLTMNTPEVFVGYHAIWRAGAVVTPVIFLQTPPELRHILEDSGARAALLYTGGTTGRAKGVMLSHHGLWRAGRGLDLVARSMGTTRTLLPLPLSHAYGLNVLVSGLHSAQEQVLVMQRWFDPQGWLELVSAHRLESSPVVPSMMQMLLDQPYAEHDLSSLQTFGCGGAPLLPSLREKIEKAFGVTILEGYGCTEASAIITAATVSENRAGSVGRPAPHVEVAILDPLGRSVPTGDEGEICARGAGVMQGYWKEPGLTARTIVDGWLRTGDVGRVDEDGYLYVVDRLKDLIIRGGFNVFPRDVEDALLEHEAVTSAAVVGVPDERSGEEVVAVVALHPGSTADPEELRDFARARLARYKYPREVRIVDAVPLTSVGKTDRKAVRSLLRS